MYQLTYPYDVIFITFCCARMHTRASSCCHRNVYLT